MNDREVIMQQALTALVAMQMEAAHRNCGLKIADDSIIALRAAIAQPEQTAPVRQPLTEEQATDFYWESPQFDTYKDAFIGGIRAIEAKITRATHD